MFHSTRLKLTAWYLLIIMSISVTFSVVIYKVLVSEVERFDRAQRFRIQRQQAENSIGIFTPPIPLANPELVEEVKQHIIVTLILVNGGILIISGGLGYMLAGRTLKPIQDMVDEQNRFISDASHELRTPLTSLKSAFEVYLRSTHPTVKEAKTLITESITEVDTLESLSASLLQLAQYQKPKNQMKVEILSLDQSITEAIHKIEPIAKQKHIEVKLQEKTGIEIQGNKHGLVDLWVILLDNAVKYSKENTQVLITMKSIDGWVHISIQDHGIGIDTKDIPHIFDRFYRSDSARTKQTTNGYGLGLSIAQKIVNSHNGTIHIESTVGVGSVFTVRLPKVFSSFSGI